MEVRHSDSDPGRVSGVKKPSPGMRKKQHVRICCLQYIGTQWAGQAGSVGRARCGLTEDKQPWVRGPS